MSGIAMAIVLASAFFHAGWNFLTKKSQRKVVFIWLGQLVALVLYFPVFYSFLPDTSIALKGWACIFTSAILHCLYFSFLGGAYERGELSLVYPLSRGSGPLVVPICAVFFIREQLEVLGMFGILLIVCGIYVIHLPSFSRQSFLKPLLALGGGASLWALLCGCTIVGYSLVDKIGVGHVPPPVYIYVMVCISSVMMAPYMLLKERAATVREWVMNWKNIVLVGFLSNFTYLLILFAMQVSKVSYVVAIREVSIVFSAVFGIVWLGEKHAKQKLMGAFLLAAGVVMIGVSR